LDLECFFESLVRLGRLSDSDAVELRSETTFERSSTPHPSQSLFPTMVRHFMPKQPIVAMSSMCPVDVSFVSRPDLSLFSNHPLPSPPHNPPSLPYPPLPGVSLPPPPALSPSPLCRPAIPPQPPTPNRLSVRTRSWERRGRWRGRRSPWTPSRARSGTTSRHLACSQLASPARPP
jgi:hypothetical protein